ncbi:MAG: iron ABC transporter substrate-binding protein [Stellaceae bacterium]
MRRISIVLSLAFLLVGAPVEARSFTDSAGRTVEVPDRVAHVLAAGPPASIIIYMLAPDRLMGWTRAPSPAERAFLPPRYADLPALGRLTGRANTSNVEDVVRLAPDLVLDIGSTTATYVSLAERVQEQTHIPDVLIDGKLANAAATFRIVGALLDVGERAEELARYAEETLTEVRQRTEQVPPERRPKVYVARGPKGLETGAQGSINLEALDFVAVHNVSAENLGPGGIVTLSPEQVLAWQPDVIVTVDRAFYASVATDPLWQGVKAVHDKRVYLAPDLPFGWIDSPPSANRLIGIRWLAKILYPELFPADLRAETRRFYRLFYHWEPTDQQLDELLAGSTPP